MRNESWLPAASRYITRARVTAVRDGLVELSDGRTIPATTLIWAAGQCAESSGCGFADPQKRGTYPR